MRADRRWAGELVDKAPRGLAVWTMARESRPGNAPRIEANAHISGGRSARAYAGAMITAFPRDDQYRTVLPKTAKAAETVYSLSRFSAALRRARVCSAWARRSRCSSTTSSGARATKFALPSLASILPISSRELLDLLLKPRALGLEVDDLADRQRIGRLAQHDLQRRLGRRRGRLDALDPRQPLDGGAMRLEPLSRRRVWRRPPAA